ncbi:DUF2500 domain-containing protein [Paenibacillus woosongensis]|uniref:DUF2500 family protein n=1 Tax=Paenibacillus woosongensis TaxID=307580 RepID=A0A7X3CQ23_9BACL|nr:DUF2500 domain-containing protein [Paenibacillus woosongensis]MUG47489.1 DUF2500 family protein [Paenibacillus woosongensis]
MQSWVEMFGVMNTALPIFFIIILGIILISVGRGILRYANNSKQPLLIVSTIIVGKRTEVSHRHNTDTAVSQMDSKYFITFEVESGDRLEFPVSGLEYGQCAEGDQGKLSFQGNRYLGFERLGKSSRNMDDGYRDLRRNY